MFGTAWSSIDPSPQFQLIRLIVVPALAVAVPSTVTVKGGVEIGYRISVGGDGGFGGGVGVGVVVFGETTVNVAVAAFDGPLARIVYDPGGALAGMVNEVVNPPSVIQTISGTTLSSLNVMTAFGNSSPKVLNDRPVTVTNVPTRPDDGERIRTGVGTILVVGVLTTIVFSTDPDSANSSEPAFAVATSCTVKDPVWAKMWVGFRRFDVEPSPNDQTHRSTWSKMSLDEWSVNVTVSGAPPSDGTAVKSAVIVAIAGGTRRKTATSVAMTIARNLERTLTTP